MDFLLKIGKISWKYKKKPENALNFLESWKILESNMQKLDI